MTDKEIIIDGVDVSGCEYCSSTPNSTLCYMKGNKCEDNPNCFYKQLQRLTAQYDKVIEQNKSLQSEVLTLKNKNNILETELSQTKLLLEGKNKQCNHLQQEYKELKTYIKEDLAPHAQMLQNEWVKTSVLDIINKTKEVNNAG